MNDQPQQLIVPPEKVGQRLDQFLAAALKRTRGEVQRKIAQGEILFDGRSVERDRRMQAGEVIEVLLDTPIPPANVPEPTIVAEDGAVLVLNKPSGLVMHRGPGINEPTLADWIVVNRPALRGVGEDPARPGIVHRLDREASGLVVVAKTQPAYDFLKTTFQEHRVEKHYLALVHGLVAQDTGEIRFPIQRSAVSGRMSARPIGDVGREAVTSYTILERLPPFTLLEIRTETGRTHQVRVHFQAVGHPIAGDPLYRPKKPQTRKQSPRLFLHAAKLSFPDSTGGHRDYNQPLPEDLQAFLDTLRRNRLDRDVKLS